MKRNKVNEKALRETQTLRPKNVRPAALQTPFPRAQDRQNLIIWRWSLPAPTDPVWWRLMHAISSYRGNRHRPPARPPQTHTHTDRTDYNTLSRS